MRHRLVTAGAPLSVALMLAVVMAGCSQPDAATTLPTGAKEGPAVSAPGTVPSPATAPSDDPSTPAAAPTASLPPGAQPGLDDYNGDGTPEPTCSTQDFGGGLKLRVLCTIIGPHQPENGTRLVPNSLYRLPGESIDLTNISGEMIFARDPAGGEVHILIFNSDELFAVDSDRLGSPGEMNAVIALINSHFTNVSIQVRGHTDSTGNAAHNQDLSVRRAQTVRTYLTTHGLTAASTTAIGFGSSRPLVEETNPDGTVSIAGRAFNRRVEIVIRGHRTS